MSKSMKPAVHSTAPKPLTEEEKKRQIARFFAQKRESYFQMILGNLLQNPSVTHETLVSVSGKDGDTHTTVNIIDIVDQSLDGADYVLEKLFPVPTEEKKEDE